jgi:formate dehydrogenase major subunit
MKVQGAASGRSSRQKLVLELLLAECRPARRDDRLPPHNELSAWAAGSGVTPRAPSPRCARSSRRPTCRTRHGGQPGRLHPVHPLRARLPREQVNDVIGLAGRGAHAKIVFDMDDPMGASAPAWPAANACRPARPAR